MVFVRGAEGDRGIGSQVAGYAETEEHLNRESAGGGMLRQGEIGGAGDAGGMQRGGAGGCTGGGGVDNLEQHGLAERVVGDGCAVARVAGARVCQHQLKQFIILLLIAAARLGYRKHGFGFPGADDEASNTDMVRTIHGDAAECGVWIPRLGYREVSRESAADACGVDPFKHHIKHEVAERLAFQTLTGNAVGERVAIVRIAAFRERVASASDVQSARPGRAAEYVVPCGGGGGGDWRGGGGGGGFGGSGRRGGGGCGGGGFRCGGRGDGGGRGGGGDRDRGGIHQSYCGDRVAGNGVTRARKIHQSYGDGFIRLGF